MVFYCLILMSVLAVFTFCIHTLITDHASLESIFNNVKQIHNACLEEHVHIILVR